MTTQEKNVKTAATSATRRVRTPINGERTILQVSQRSQEPGWHYAWILEKNVYGAQEAGYEHVRHAVEVGQKRIDVGQGQGSYVTQPSGGGQLLFLMRQPEEFYQEDLKIPAQKAAEQFQARVADLSRDGLDGSISEQTATHIQRGHTVR